MSKKLTLFSVLFNDFYPFNEFAKSETFLVRDPKVLSIGKQDPKNCLLILWGGEDIHPSLYRQERCFLSGAPHNLSNRDRLERDAYFHAVKLGIPVIGICRGAQMVCALNGGKLVQHVSGHGIDHEITTSDGTELLSTSTHHQMMLPSGDFELVAWSSRRRSNVYFGEQDHDIPECFEDGFREPEIVFWPKTKTLGIQGHPEYLETKSPFVKYTQKLLKEKLNVG